MIRATAEHDRNSSGTSLVATRIPDETFGAREAWHRSRTIPHLPGTDPAPTPSLRGGAADAAIQFHPLTTLPPHHSSENQNLWIATSATPPRNDVWAGVAPPSRQNAQPTEQPCKTVGKLPHQTSQLSHLSHLSHLPAPTPVIARRRSRRGNPVPSSDYSSATPPQRPPKPLDCHVGYASSQ